ncbi:MAG TPA: hypothetical protein VKL40_15380 [Candidatus Angelobacter sp.]|nr:hypothetical protein [Candidatus Angelobacter sp.]
MMSVALVSAAALAIGANAGSASRSVVQLSQAKPTPTPDPTEGVEVTALALEPSRFCAFGPDAYVVYIPIDVTIVNGRRAPIILARALQVQRVLLGKTNDDVQAGRYELGTPVRAARLRADSTAFGPAPDDDTFAVLKHNQKFEFTVVYGIPVRNNRAQTVPGTAYPGNLAFSVELQTWPFARNAAGLQQQWVRYGDLIAAPVIAFPTILRLPANPTTENCHIRR